jgi:DNA gyrase inhibitor GyrI
MKHLLSSLIMCIIILHIGYNLTAQRPSDQFPLLVQTTMEGQGLNVNYLAEPTTYTESDHDPVRAWRWDFGDGHSASESHPQHTYKEAGRYKVCVTAEGALGVVRHCRGIRIGEGPVHTYEGMQISYHPGSGQLHIWFDDLAIGARMHMRDSSGHTLFNVPIAPESSPLNFRELPSGRYTFSVRQPHVEEDVFEWYLGRE